MDLTTVPTADLLTAAVILTKFDEDQPRDDIGRWTDGGGGSAAQDTPARPDYTAYEAGIAAMNPSREYGAVYDREGNKVWDGKGAKASMRFPPGLIRQGFSLTHFHPSSIVAYDAAGHLVGKPSPGASLSHGDIETHLHEMLGTTRCFDNNGHWMQVDGQGSRLAFGMAWRSQWAAAQKIYDRWISEVSHRPGTWNSDDDSRKQFEVYRDALVTSATMAGLKVTYG